MSARTYNAVALPSSPIRYPYGIVATPQNGFPVILDQLGDSTLLSSQFAVWKTCCHTETVLEAQLDALANALGLRVQSNKKPEILQAIRSYLRATG